MFQDLDLSLKALFAPPVLNPPAFPLLRASDKSFLTPDKNFTPAQNTVNLFLYDVKENRDLRDNTPILEKQGATFVRRPPPVRMNCSYVATAWSTGTADAKIATEHQLLAEALHWLSGFSAIPQAILDTLPAGSPLKEPIYALPLSVAQLDPDKNTGDFWIALGIPPRSAFHLMVVVPMILDLPVHGELVTTRSTRSEVAGSGDTWVQIGGRVLDQSQAPPAPIAGAVVEIVNAGLQTTSNAEGRYQFPRVPAGASTVRASATGFQVLERPLSVPDWPENYDLLLNPL